MIKLVDASVWMEFIHPKGSKACKDAVAGLMGAREAGYCGLVELELLAGARTPREEAWRGRRSFSSREKVRR